MMAWRNQDGSRGLETVSNASLQAILQGYSVEITARDVEATTDRMPAGKEVFVANLPNDGLDVLVEAAARLSDAGLVPVPHIVARNLAGVSELDRLIARLRERAKVEKVLALGGDRDEPAGELSDSLALVTSGVFEKHGVKEVSLASYPEGHPRIGGDILRTALRDKIAAVTDLGLKSRLVSQFAFEPGPIIEMARRLREDGITVPLRIGVAGPASTTKLIKYAMRCGVGASLRALTERKGIAASLLGGETPEAVLQAVARAAASEPGLAIEGVHFFTFGAPLKSVEWAQGQID